MEEFLLHIMNLCLSYCMSFNNTTPWCMLEMLVKPTVCDAGMVDYVCQSVSYCISSILIKTKSYFTFRLQMVMLTCFVQSNMPVNGENLGLKCLWYQCRTLPKAILALMSFSGFAIAPSKVREMNWHKQDTVTLFYLNKDCVDKTSNF